MYKGLFGNCNYTGVISSGEAGAILTASALQTGLPGSGEGRNEGIPPPHLSKFNIDEVVLPLSVELHIHTALRFLGG